ncbi:hypothetical protein OpiT1DRAFT_04854 [Opitutaceae bacterium TAV1]|nr:hypothetical protein OpiT1DRAFT_04854 [Opitutaceae bacterium TAV1]
MRPAVLSVMIADPAPACNLPARQALPGLLDALSAALAACVDEPADSAAMKRLASLRRETAFAVASLPRNEARDPVVIRIRILIRQLAASGFQDGAVASGDEAGPEISGEGGWPGLLAAMLLAPAWRLRAAPPFDAVPDWLWADYAAWLFVMPAVFASPDEAAACASVVLARMEDLARWTERNIGSAAVTAAVEAWLPFSSPVTLRTAGVDTRRHAEARAKILARYFRCAPGAGADGFLPLPRAGRRLRTGFVAGEWSRSPATCAALARFEHLSPADFEVVLFSLREEAETSPFAEKCRSLAGEFHTLPASPDEQVEALRLAALDVLVFPETIALAHDGITRLALHRCAPLQVMAAVSGMTSGFPEIELVAGCADDVGGPERFSERPGVLNGPSRVFALQPAPGEGTLVFSREDLGVPMDAVLLVTMLATPTVSAPELASWTRILARVPEAYLLVFLVPERHGPPGGGERLLAALQGALLATGIDPEKARVLAPGEAAFAECRAVLNLADICLAAPGGAHAFWAAAGVDAGLPVVVVGETGGEDEAIRLVASPEAREAMRARLAEEKAEGHEFLDTLAASDAFGHLIEAAFDELEAEGREAFRAAREPLRCGAFTHVAEAVAAGFDALARDDAFAAAFEAGQALRCAPDDPDARHLYGQIVLAGERTKDAVTYLLAAVEQRPKRADYWFTLARALSADGQKGEATRALQTSLRLDPSRAESWLLLVELAEGAGATEIARDAVAALRSAHPGHPGLDSLEERYPS